LLIKATEIKPLEPETGNTDGGKNEKTKKQF